MLKGYSTVLQGTKRVLQECYKEFRMVVQGCYNIRVLQGCYKSLKPRFVDTKKNFDKKNEPNPNFLLIQKICRAQMIIRPKNVLGPKLF